jgi:hypothetical protein
MLSPEEPRRELNWPEPAGANASRENSIADTPLRPPPKFALPRQSWRQGSGGDEGLRITARQIEAF